MDDRIACRPPPILARIEQNIWTAPFWEAAARRELAFPACSSCGRFRMPPTAFCPYCRSQGTDWSRELGEGVLYSYTIVDRTIVPGEAIDLPYVPAIIEFPDADGVRLISNIVGSPISAIAIGVAVTLRWGEADEGLWLPLFEISPDHRLRLD